jgi:phosphoglycolate phosphatase-like HAD superfamily hydrolase
MTDVDAILFDLDGTLLDTAPDMVGALNTCSAKTVANRWSSVPRGLSSRTARRDWSGWGLPTQCRSFRTTAPALSRSTRTMPADATAFVGIEEVLVALGRAANPGRGHQQAGPSSRRRCCVRSTSTRAAAS